VLLTIYDDFNGIFMGNEFSSFFIGEASFSSFFMCAGFMFCSSPPCVCGSEYFIHDFLCAFICQWEIINIIKNAPTNYPFGKRFEVRAHLSHRVRKEAFCCGGP
jgi:hypothetical protein